jgi:hypothetical protein
MRYITDFKSFQKSIIKDINSLNLDLNQYKDLESEFLNLCEGYINNEISLSDFTLRVNESVLINESWFSDLGDNIKKKWSISSNFFSSILSKIKIFIKKYLIQIFKKETRDKVLEMISVFFEKFYSGLNTFGEFLKKNKKGLYSILKKISISLGISFTVSYLLSFFGVGWVAAMGVKIGASSISKQITKKIGESVEQIKKGAIALGKGIISFFKVLRKFKIAILIFFGTVFILNLIFDPFFEPLVHIANLHHLSDIFSDNYTPPTSFNPIDTTKVDTVKNLHFEKVGPAFGAVQLNSEHITEDDNVSQIINQNISKGIESVKPELTKHPQEAAKQMGDLVNQLMTHSKGDVKVEHQDLTYDQYKQTVSEDDLHAGKSTNLDNNEDDMRWKSTGHGPQSQHDVESNSEIKDNIIEGDLTDEKDFLDSISKNTYLLLKKYSSELAMDEKQKADFLAGKDGDYKFTIIGDKLKRMFPLEAVEEEDAWEFRLNIKDHHVHLSEQSNEDDDLHSISIHSPLDSDKKIYSNLDVGKSGFYNYECQKNGDAMTHKEAIKFGKELGLDKNGWKLMDMNEFVDKSSEINGKPYAPMPGAYYWVKIIDRKEASEKINQLLKQSLEK